MLRRTRLGWTVDEIRRPPRVAHRVRLLNRPVRLRLWGAVVGAMIFLAGLAAADLYDWASAQIFSEDPEPPFHIALELDPAGWEEGNIFGGESYEWIFPSPPSLLRRPPRGACYRRYDWSKGPAGVAGIDARTTRFRLTIQSGGDQSVLLERLAPVIHRRLPGDEGTHVACPVGGAAANLRRFAVDLDRGTGVFTDGEGNPLPTTMLKFGPQDSEPILVVATANRARFDWALRLNFVVDGKPVPAYVNDEIEGQLFSTTGVGRAKTVHWAGKRWLPGEGPPVGHHSP